MQTKWICQVTTFDLILNQLSCLWTTITLCIMFDFLSGTFSDAAATVCTPCPPGYACPNSSDSTQKFPCPLGTYSVGSKTECTECPIAHRCPHKEYVFYFCLSSLAVVCI